MATPRLPVHALNCRVRYPRKISSSQIAAGQGESQPYHQLENRLGMMADKVPIGVDTQKMNQAACDRHGDDDESDAKSQIAEEAFQRLPLP